MKTKILALLLCAVMLCTLSGCASSPVVMEYGDEEVTVNMYRYWLSTYKGSFMNVYTDMRDTDAFWDSELFEGTTAEEYLTGAVIDNVKRTLVCASLFDSRGLKMSESDLKNIDDYIETLITERADGSRKSFNQMLSVYGINIDMLRKIYTMEDKTSLLFENLYGKDGELALTEEAYEKYCQENYVRIRHIYVNDAYVYETDEKGYYKYDSSGRLQTRDLTADEKAEKAKKIADIEAALAKGEKFDDVYKKYSEDLYYENGYYICATTNFVSDVVVAAMNLEVGKSARVDSDYGTHFILRMEMDEKPYKDTENADFFENFETDAKNAAFYDYLEELLPAVTIDEEALKEYSIRDAVPNYSI
ncbi:MAG: hypothetical protein E7662_12750 [Ruminococcaceae bacterium]|nr:hypothetical protein [Oscillospiraceae bacterium]